MSSESEKFPVKKGVTQGSDSTNFLSYFIGWKTIGTFFTLELSRSSVEKGRLTLVYQIPRTSMCWP